MTRRAVFCPLAGLLTLLLTACAAAEPQIAAAPPPPAGAPTAMTGLDDHSQPPPNQRFATLDDYLAHRRRLGAQDYPFYEEAGPGLYRLVGGRRPRGAGPADYPTYTREQLLRRYGFRE